MPRNVRNFWLELDVDGKRTRVETGPQSKDGGFSLDVKMRDEGGIVRAALLTGRVGDGGELKLTFTNALATNAEQVTIRTQR